MYPKSHTADLVCSKSYHVVDDAQLRQLAEMGIHEQLIPASTGDTLIMQGGVVVHGSVAVPADSPPRFAAYAHFCAQ